MRAVTGFLIVLAFAADARAESPPCLEMPAIVHGVDGTLVVCADADKGECTALGATPQDDRKVSHPDGPTSSSTGQTGGLLQAPTLSGKRLCLGEKCRTIGANAAAAIAAGLAGDAQRTHGVHVQVTADLARAAINIDSPLSIDLWNLGADRKVPIVPARNAKVPPRLYLVHILGTTVLGTFACYDGSCVKPQWIIGAKGQRVGTPWKGGPAAVLDRKRIAALSEYPNVGELAVIDTATGKHVELALEPTTPDRSTIARLSDTSLAVGWAAGKVYRLARVIAKPGKAPVLDGAVRTFPICAIK